MGVGPSFFSLYTRNISTDKYNEKTIFHIEQNERFNIIHAIGCFKHEMFAFAMGKLEDTKAIYLYEDNWRIAKAIRTGNDTFDIIFRNNTYKKMWYDTEERLPPKRWPLLERSFDKVFQTSEKSDTILYVNRFTSV